VTNVTPTAAAVETADITDRRIHSTSVVTSRIGATTSETAIAPSSE
jgi:hypothetical protein